MVLLVNIVHMHFIMFIAFLRFCDKVYGNFKTILRSKGNEVPEKWSVLLDRIETRAYTRYAHSSFDANAEMTGRERRITMSVRSL